MTEPARSEPSSDLDLLAPLQALDFESGTDEPGRFAVRAIVTFSSGYPMPEVILRVYSEATDLTPEAVEALKQQARELRAGFALYLSAGAMEIEEEGPFEEPPDPDGTAAFIIEPELTNPTDNPLVRRLVESVELLTVIDPCRDPGDSPIRYSYSRRYRAKIYVSDGKGHLSSSEGSRTAVEGYFTSPLLGGKRFTVVAQKKHTCHTFYKL